MRVLLITFILFIAVFLYACCVVASKTDKWLYRKRRNIMRKEIEITRLVNQQNPLDREDMPLELAITDQNENNFHEYVDPTLKPIDRKSVV